jgi:hypothetical protein
MLPYQYTFQAQGAMLSLLSQPHPALRPEFYAMFNTACPGLFGTPAEFRKDYEASLQAQSRRFPSALPPTGGLPCSL